MSQFSGPQGRRAMRARKEQKRKEAEARAKSFNERKNAEAIAEYKSNNTRLDDTSSGLTVFGDSKTEGYSQEYLW